MSVEYEFIINNKHNKNPIFFMCATYSLSVMF